MWVLKLDRNTMNVKIPPIFCSLKKLECSLESLKYKKKNGFVVVLFPTVCAPSFRVFVLFVVMTCVICATLCLQIQVLQCNIHA